MSHQKDLVNQWFIDIINLGKLELIEQVVHEEYRDGPNHTGPTGPEFVRLKFSGMSAVVTDTVIEIKELVEEDNKVACHYVSKFTVIDSFMGISSPGTRLVQEGVTFFTFKDNKIFYTWGTYDRATLKQQLQEGSKTAV